MPPSGIRMRILVTFAVEAEFAPWRKRHNFECQLIDIPPIAKSSLSYQADFNGITVDVWLTGVGWENSIHNSARDGLRVMFEEKPDFCVSTGLAGGLKPEWRCADIVAATEIGSYQSDATVKSNRYAMQVAQSSGAKIAHRLITWNHVVGESKVKQAMGASADIVDMESYFILAMAGGAQIPAIAVRAVSDPSNEDLPIDFSKVTDRQGHVVVAQFVRELSRHPGRIPGLVLFGRRSRKAISVLADFLDDFIPSLARDRRKIAASAYGRVTSQ
jgi:nucleoside phosphorylase